MANTEVAAKVNRNPEEEMKHEARRVIHEFATYCVYHLSLTKPDALQLRILINELLSEWADNEYDCGIPNCIYCAGNETTKRFRHIFRRFVTNERGRR